jgi:hypothetical protein
MNKTAVRYEGAAYHHQYHSESDGDLGDHTRQWVPEGRHSTEYDSVTTRETCPQHTFESHEKFVTHMIPESTSLPVGLEVIQKRIS